MRLKKTFLLTFICILLATCNQNTTIPVAKAAKATPLATTTSKSKSTKTTKTALQRLKNYEFELDGKSYKLPLSVSTLTSKKRMEIKCRR